MSEKIRSLICALILLAATHVEGQTAWTYSKEVRFERLQDPGRVIFENHKEVSVRWGTAGQLTFEETEKWAKSKRLSIAFSPEEGPVLLDPESGKRVSVIEIEPHPIGLVLDKCLKAEQSTRGAVECYNRGISLWDKELNRLYGQLMRSKKSDLTGTVQTAQRAWLRYRDTTRAVIGNAYTEGTVSQINRSVEYYMLTKEQTLRLQRFVSECDDCRARQ
jgi:uncharacterized protein YecT (DUF1311 family)